MPKRKRGSAASTRDDTDHGLPSDKCPFRVEYLVDEETPKNAANTRRKRLKSSTGNEPTYITLSEEELGSLESPEGSSSLKYRVLPIAAWSSMRQYRNFIVNGTNHTLGGFVQVRAGSLEQPGRSVFDDGTHWIARVLEIRASDPTHVYLRIIWMYWPRELPWGSQYYHGMNELIASNHMEIVGAATVSEGVRVDHVQESPEGTPTIEGLFWRQKYDYANRNALAELRSFCVCGRYHNADKLLIHCENSKCGLWLHEDCLIKATLEEISSDSPAATEDSEVTKVEEDQLQKELHESIEVSSMSRNSPRKAVFPRSKAVEVQARVLGDTIRQPGYILDGRLRGELEKKIDAKGDDNITGRLIVENLEGDSLAPRSYPMRCLACNKRL